ncbi:hypothetical protein TrVGV298_002366 [Trichoderma virens]|nr:hypothetical protein TrVGV298_002366 [Trichoderma virens]
MREDPENPKQPKPMMERHQGVARAPASAATPTRASLRTSARRSHPKTRTGCKTCKRRKIKCDETQPACRNCLKHSVTCDFQKTAGVANALSHPECPLVLVDLELLHNFTSATFSTLSTDPTLRTVWKTAIIRKAIDCDYVMRSILAVSAMHLAQYRPERRENYMRHGIHHHHLASGAATSLLRDPLPENCENLWIFSVLTMYFALGTPRTSETSLLIGDSVFPDWIFLLSGVKHLLVLIQQTARSGILSSFINHGSARWKSSHEPQHEKSNILDLLYQRVTSAVTDEHELSVYRHAIHELRCQISFTLASNSKALDIMDAFVWQFEVAETFMPLLRQMKMEAIVIFAHSCVILNALQGNKWLQGWGEFLISKVWTILDDEHKTWVDWPIQEIGWVPP